eukprot:1119699-Amphidinium_carterae.1
MISVATVWYQRLGSSGGIWTLVVGILRCAVMRGRALETYCAVAAVHRRVGSYFRALSEEFLENKSNNHNNYKT